jgi:N-sulfoglucosamine sulfohydrolase
VARDFVCSARDRLDNNPEMVRTIRTHKYRYHRNFLPHQPYASFYPDGGFFAEVPEQGTPERDFWETSCLPGEEKVHGPDGIFLIEQGLPEQYQQYPIWQDHKPHEELYDIQSDPEQMRNLADDPAFADIKDELRGKLFGWMVETADLGLIDETEIVVRAAEYDGVSRLVGVNCNNFERILETADLSRLAEAGRKELLNRLDDPDSAVRFWAVTGLSSFDLDAEVIESLKPRLDDESISVSLAAADYLVRAGEGALTLPALTRALASDILWARMRAGAYLSYCGRQQLLPMKPLVPALQAAAENQSFFGPEHDRHIEANFSMKMIDAQRDVIAKLWVMERVAERIELS